MKQKSFHKIATKSSNKLDNHKQRVYNFAGELIKAANKHRPEKQSEFIKGIGFFLVEIGESMQKGSIKLARKIELEGSSVAETLPVGLCIYGDQIMNWSIRFLDVEIKEIK